MNTPFMSDDRGEVHSTHFVGLLCNCWCSLSILMHFWSALDVRVSSCPSFRSAKKARIGSTSWPTSLHRQRMRSSFAIPVKKASFVMWRESYDFVRKRIALFTSPSSIVSNVSHDEPKIARMAEISSDAVDSWECSTSMPTGCGAWAVSNGNRGSLHLAHLGLWHWQYSCKHNNYNYRVSVIIMPLTYVVVVFSILLWGGASIALNPLSLLGFHGTVISSRVYTCSAHNIWYSMGCV